MKSLSLKFACVFIILIFCLAPLSAIDLNQDDNNKYINQDDDNGIAVDDVDITADDVDNETVEIDAEDSTDGNMASDVDSKDIDQTNEMEDNSDYDYLNIHVDDITEGKPAVIEVTTQDFVSAGVYVNIEGQEPIFLWVDHGHASTTVDGLKSGTYTAHVSLQGSSLKNSTTFTVKERPEPNLSLNVEDTHPGQKAVAEVHTDKAYTGEVVLKLDGSITKTISMENGYGKVTFDEDLSPGTHTVEAISSETPEFAKSQKTASFTVSDEIYLDVEVEDVKQGEPIVVKVKTTKGYNGFEYVVLENIDMKYGYAQDGYYTCTFDSEELEPGTHEITAYALQKDGYRGSKTTVHFNVNERLDPELSVDVEDTYLCQDAVAKVHINENYTGNVDIKIDGSEAKHVNIENGYGEVNFGEVNPGQHTVEVSSSSTPEFAKSQKTASFTAKNDLYLDVNVDDISQGEPVVVKVQSAERYNGFVVCTLDSGAMEIGYAQDGYFVCTFDGDDMAPGTHVIDVHAQKPNSFAFTAKVVEFNVK